MRLAFFIAALLCWQSCSSSSQKSAGEPAPAETPLISAAPLPSGQNTTILPAPITPNQSLQQQTVLPPPTDLAVGTPIPGVRVAYNMRGVVSRSNPNAAAIQMVIQDGALKNQTSINITGNLRSLKNSSAVRPIALPATVYPSGLIDVVVDGLQPETVYRLEEVRLTSSTGATESLKDPYFLVTGGTTPLAEARRAIVLRALAEAYDWDHSNYDKAKGYAASSGWCDRFYSWSVTNNFSLDYPDYAPSWFSQNRALSSASELPTIASRESVHGDMIRYDGIFLGFHTFMILSYDLDAQKIWSVEGNYNNRVERDTRQIKTGWKLGHLTANLVK